MGLKQHAVVSGDAHGDFPGKLKGWTFRNEVGGLFKEEGNLF